jgi:hypothetical protein
MSAPVVTIATLPRRLETGMILIEPGQRDLPRRNSRRIPGRRRARPDGSLTMAEQSNHLLARAMFLALVASLAVITSASAAVPATRGLTVITDGGKTVPILQTWVNQGYAPVIQGYLLVHNAYCPDIPRTSCVRSSLRPREMWLHTQDPSQLRWLFTHELGHSFDYVLMNDKSRRVFRWITGLGHQRRCPAGKWEGPRIGSRSCMEQFADAYGFCMRHRTITRNTPPGDYGYDPTPRMHLAVCALLRRVAGGWYGPPTEAAETVLGAAAAPRHIVYRRTPAADPSSPVLSCAEARSAIHEKFHEKPRGVCNYVWFDHKTFRGRPAWSVWKVAQTYDYRKDRWSWFVQVGRVT